LAAYETLKEKIIVGFFLPGQYLNEAAISHQLGYGRTPVHQALQRLQVEGLVEVVPRKGVIIQPDSAGQIIDILDARIVVEPELVRSAARHATSEALRELERILLNEPRSSADTSIALFIEKDRAFHAKIAAISANAVLADFARTLHERSIRYWLLTMWQMLDTTATDREHRAILQAIRKHDPTAASKAMRTHLLRLRSRLTHLQRTGRLRP
jgi:DNA-binding GntR family transcriptional regulator